MLIETEIMEIGHEPLDFNSTSEASCNLPIFFEYNQVLDDVLVCSENTINVQLKTNIISEDSKTFGKLNLNKISFFFT